LRKGEGGYFPGKVPQERRSLSQGEYLKREGSGGKKREKKISEIEDLRD